MLTLAIIKPDAVGSGLAGKIIAHLEAQGFVVRAVRMTRLSKSQAQAFYEVHRERPFFGSLVEYMTSAPCVPMALERDDGEASGAGKERAGRPVAAEAKQEPEKLPSGEVRPSGAGPVLGTPPPKPAGA